MTNEELALRIKAGERDLLPVLWEQVRRYVEWQARKTADWLGGGYGVVADDLVQGGYFALLAAVEAYNEKTEFKFLTFLKVALRNAFADVAGLRTKKRKLDPINCALSLEEPIEKDGDSFTIADALPDNRAEQAFDEIEQRELLEIIARALDTLSEQQKRVILLRYWDGLSLDDVSHVVGTAKGTTAKLERKALMRLRHPGINSELHEYARENGVGQTKMIKRNL